VQGNSETSDLMWLELKYCFGSYETENYLQDNEGFFLLKVYNQNGRYFGNDLQIICNKLQSSIEIIARTRKEVTLCP
jgi:hypothetical protein